MATETLEKETLELSNNCTCEDEEGNYSDECFGCYDDSRSYLFDHIVPLWESRNKATDNIRIEGANMGWMHESGWLVTEAKNLLDALSINGDYTLVFTLEGADLKVMRYSHDEHGASFEITFVPDEECLV